MRGSAAFRTGVAPGGALAGPWTRNPLWASARAVPSLDLRFADNKSLTDATTGANLVTFTRASSGTYVGSDGVLRTAVTNLLLRSEEFDNASWINQNSTEAVDASIATPAGGSNAYRLTDTGVSGTHNIYQTTTIGAGVAVTFSIYARESSIRYIRLGNTFSATDYAVADFDLQTAVVTQTGNGSTGTVSNAAVQSVGNGWVRCSATLTTAGTNRTVGVHTLTSGTMSIAGFGVSNYIGVGNYVHIWGAQLEQSSTVGEYIPTTSAINSAPRFDHNPTTGESLGLLVEEQRTNLLSSSENFTAAGWGSGINGTTVTANAGIAPNGTSTASSIAGSTGSGTRVFTVAAGPGTTLTISCFVKAGTATSLSIGMSDLTTGDAAMAVDLATGNVLATTFAGSWTSGSYRVERLSNQWFRISVTATKGAGTFASAYLLISSPNNILAWGFQIEAGAFPTSYIPTTTTALTRSADVASITGSNFSSWYNQPEGTMFVSAEDKVIFPSTLRHYADLNANSLNLSIAIVQSNAPYIGPGQNIVAGIYNSSLQSAIDLNAQTTGALRASIAYKANDVSASRNGVLGTPDTSASLPTPTRLTIGADAFGTRLINSTIARLTYWPTRLANTTLQQITQP